MKHFLTKHITKHMAVLTAIILLFSMTPLTVHAAGTAATIIGSSIIVDGEYQFFEAYTINGNNYFKLRDIAYVLSGTQKQFDVTWDGGKNAINLATGRPYTVVGNEMAPISSYSKKTAVLSTSTILLNGKPLKLTAYTIGGYNYFKLRDLASALDFSVEWDGYNNTVVIDSLFGYVPDNSGDTYNLIRNIGLGDTQMSTISRWASVSNVQQFSYRDEGLGYAYSTGTDLKIVTPGKTLTIDKKYPKLGDVIADDDGNFYIVWGQEGEVNTDVTMFISKYSPSGKHMATTGFVGDSPLDADGNTKIPFHAGNCDSAIHDGVLMVNYAREMYNGHQSNNVIAVNIADMSPYILGSSMPYVSHSFNQSVIYSELANDFIFANHGDAYGRGFMIDKLEKDRHVNPDILQYEDRYPQHNIFHFYLPANTNYNMYVVNRTYAQLGGLAETSKGVVLAGASAKSLGPAAEDEKQNLFVQIFNPLASLVTPYMFVGGTVRSGETSLNIYDNQNQPLTRIYDFGVIWLTNYIDRDVITPQVVVGDDRIVILWAETDETGNTLGSFYMVLSAGGEVVTPRTSLGRLQLNSYESPVYHNGSVYWAYVHNNTLRVASIAIK